VHAHYELPRQLQGRKREGLQPSSRSIPLTASSQTRSQPSSVCRRRRTTCIPTTSWLRRLDPAALLPLPAGPRSAATRNPPTFPGAPTSPVGTAPTSPVSACSRTHRWPGGPLPRSTYGAEPAGSQGHR
jgi:hypothetical protein